MADKDEFSAFMVRRDSDGKVVPYTVTVTGVLPDHKPLTIDILPTTVGSMKGLSDPNGDCIHWPVEDKIRYVREHVVRPDFGSLTGDQLMEQMTMWDLDMVLITAIQHGGPMRQKEEAKKKKTGPTKSGRSKKRSPR